MLTIYKIKNWQPERLSERDGAASVNAFIDPSSEMEMVLSVVFIMHYIIEHILLASGR